VTAEEQAKFKKNFVAGIGAFKITFSKDGLVPGFY